ncbi:MAG: hypothetical protein PF689_01330, partial [Deltaproteobacteria bacterium]|nr:hypothetical protein [Deltaproteobacteria bacterium]
MSKDKALQGNVFYGDILLTENVQIFISGSNKIRIIEDEPMPVATELKVVLKTEDIEIKGDCVVKSVKEKVEHDSESQMELAWIELDSENIKKLEELTDSVVQLEEPAETKDEMPAKSDEEPAEEASDEVSDEEPAEEASDEVSNEEPAEEASEENSEQSVEDSPADDKKTSEEPSVDDEVDT